ncbi:hypothetical protein [Vagococcus luciliae]|uniref:Uncharacterized protein n=1 Tax=Vagococcus luciliae TaxID=2920380 RepID=A0ABY5NYH9_9ENTE|nr:hypothetical protein [Vagococcus luciliae]UUV98715.1 hypothetical protein G314FT_08690 [Vagococcus luciliae]
MNVVEKINKKIVELKKEEERLVTKRLSELGNSINYIENEIEIQRCNAQIDILQELLEEI